MSNSTLHNATRQPSSDEHASSLKDLHRLRIKHPKNVIVSYININSIRNKFENFIDFIEKKVDILAFAETKLDSNFSKAQFQIPCFAPPCPLDLSGNSGGLLVFLNAQIPLRELKR